MCHHWHRSLPHTPQERALAAAMAAAAMAAAAVPPLPSWAKMAHAQQDLRLRHD
jgi:hypothetical protein